MSSIQNLSSTDPFAEDFGSSGDSSVNYTHIRIFQRSGRKALTTIEGLPKKIDQNLILKHLKKEFCCNGSILKDDQVGQVIQLQGDHRNKIAQFLIDEKIVPKNNIKIHGF